MMRRQPYLQLDLQVDVALHPFVAALDFNRFGTRNVATIKPVRTDKRDDPVRACLEAQFLVSNLMAVRLAER